MKKNDDFDFVNLPEAAQDPEIKQEDFVLQQADSTIHEQRFQTKPTTFLKDSLKRFSKNKSSVVAAYILGFLILLSIFVPIFNTNDVSNAANAALINLEPKLFNSGSGFWDGTTKVKHCPVDPNNSAHPFYPDPTVYYYSGVKDLQVEDGLQYTNEVNKFGQNGYVQTGFYGGKGNNVSYLNSKNPKELSADYRFTLDLNTDVLTLDRFVAVDEEMLKEAEGTAGVIPENFTLGLTGLEFVYYEGDDLEVVELVSPDYTHTIGETGGEPSFNISEAIKTATGKTTFDSFYFRFVTSKPAEVDGTAHVCSLIKSFIITTNSTNDAQEIYFSNTTDPVTLLDGICFLDATKMMVRSYEVGSGSKLLRNSGFWSIDNTTSYLKRIYLSKSYFASFTYDSYEATLGEREWSVDNFDLLQYQRNGWIDFNIDVDYVGGQYVVDTTTFDFVILNRDKCPLVNEIDASDINILGYVDGDPIYYANVKVIYYKYLGYDEMPKYLFGTDRTGRDMFKYVFEGLRNSLLLGLLTFVVCFLFGLLWGSVSGYFGGAVDLVMERVTDILSGVPWIVVMTIVILKAGSSFGTFALALCLTGWIGTASTTRTQFYRFRGREYVLASRTLGASDGRLIAKHILPNALGTIITGAVLMIPSVIFSEATISYLGLGFKNLSSLGVILSNNQSELTYHPYQLLFPSVVIALVMISFNLFGNGLRDAINPSLKGEE
ncbi:MAG: ABC transporter permease [Bacilli bacterium]|nr:ABC transporter permease [Bacilli bacterium]